MYLAYRILVGSFVLCGWLLYWFAVVLGVTLLALWKLAVGLYKLLAKVLEHELVTDQQKPSIKAEPGPRDYNLPE